ncbi:MAG: ADP-ribosylglycohydrolase family protein [Planctomycetes bacterium]|nr:ADP-ribosylglycohydrolase family protein [Planctomycetota bacterium]MCB9888234.1 ADP-ribosylglycohydrolase family protein [Planctomycetota bacterium]
MTDADVAKPPATRDALLGCLLGTAVGDALGLPYEGLSPRRGQRMLGTPDRYRFLFGRGMVSDDTEHAVLVAAAFARAHGDPDDLARRLARSLRWWLAGLPAGVGLATLRAIVRSFALPPGRSGVHSAGNGPAMRAAPLGVLAPHAGAIPALVRAATELTHRDPRAFDGALAVAAAAHAAARGQRLDPEGLLRLLPDAHPDLRTPLERLGPSLARGETTPEFAESVGLARGVTGYVCHTVPVCLHAALALPNDFAGAIRAVIACGGDSDTTAAIAGGIVGAGVGEHGIPRHLIDGLAEWPFGVAWLQRFVDRVVAASEPPAIPFLGRLPRNALFTATVLSHGFRRLLPPY